MSDRNLGPGGIARLSARRPWITILAWVVMSALIVTGGSVTHQKDYDDDFTTAIESQVGQDLIDKHFGESNGLSETLIFASDTYTVDDPEFRSVVEGTLANLQPFQDDFVSVANYYEAPEAPELQALVGSEGRALVVPIKLAGEWSDYDDSYPGFSAAMEASRADGFEIGSLGVLSGGEIGEMYGEDMEKDIKIGLPVAAVVLLVVFGSLVAAGLPLVLGIVTIVTATGLAQIVGGVMVMEDAGMMLVTMIGLAVGIDYSLFLLERYREERRNGATKPDAIERAGATAGKAVLFSGGTVLLALLGLLLMPITIFQGMGVSTALTVVVAVAAGLTLLPALVRLCGDWIDFPRFGRMRSLRRQDETGISQFPEIGQGTGVWGRLASSVMKRPAVYATLTAGLLLLASVPVFTMELGQQSVESLPESNYRTSYELMAEHFYAGQDSPVSIVVTGDISSPSTQERVDAFIAAADADGRYSHATTRTSEGNEVLVIDLMLRDDPFTESGQGAVADLRGEYVPQAFGSAQGEVYVAGAPAMVMDFNSELSDNLPYVFAFVLGLSFVLLMIAFRSIVVPVMSIVLNLLSVGAAYGSVVLVFQHGWFADLLGLTEVEVITNWLPVMLFCILFGLSMDYHVFLLSRVREAWDHTGDNEASIVTGLQSTGRIITGAALIMVAVFSAFALGRMSEMQQMGFGLGMAVLLDATLIRTILVPATMRLLGNWNWYMPKVLHWLPEIHVEGKLEPIRLQRLEGEHASAD
jgi:putative drug exporter of the RND superfamily